MEQATERDISAEIRRKFAAALQVMSTEIDRHGVNFAQCAAQVTGDPNALPQLRGMIEFSRQLAEFGLQQAHETIQENSGIPVQVVIPLTTSEEKQKPGYVVGLDEYDIRKKMFGGVAVMQTRKGQETFVRVVIRPTGETILQPMESLKLGDPTIKRLMKELYPRF